MTLLYFAQAKRVTGTPSETLAAPTPLTTDQLLAEILRLHPDLALLHPVIRLARNGEFASADTVFQPDDEIALIPPVSGG